MALRLPGERIVYPAFISKGQRDNQVFSYGRSVWAQQDKEHPDQNALLEAMMEFNNSRCVPPLSEQQVRAKAQSVMRKPAGLSPEYEEKRKSAKTKRRNARNSEDSPFAKVGFTDRELAPLFAERTKDAICYVPETKSWWEYLPKQGIWQNNDSAGFRYLNEFIYQMECYANDIADGQERKDRSWAAHKYDNYTKAKNLLSAATAYAEIHISEFDSKSYLACAKNCTIELPTRLDQPFVIREHRAEDHLTLQLNVNYDPNAYAGTWEEHLDQVFASALDMRLFAQARFGYALTGDTSLDALYYCAGIERAGKTTTIDAIKRVFGTYAKSPNASIFAKKSKWVDPYKPNSELASLRAARLAIVEEPDIDMIVDDAMLKRITGGAPITTRFLGKNSFEYYPQFTLFFDTNHLPKTFDQTLVRSGRVNIIRFINRLPEEARNEDKGKELESEENKSAILNWLLNGYLIHRQFKPRPPERMLEEVRAYAEANDQVRQFVIECCTVRDDLFEKGTIIYSYYKDVWCSEVGIRPEHACGRNTFFKRLEELGFMRKKQCEYGKNVFFGLQTTGNDDYVTGEL